MFVFTSNKLAQKPATKFPNRPKNAYLSISKDEKSQRAFAFYGPNKEILCFCHLPNGFKNAGFFLQQNLIKILHGFPVIFCADDIITFTEDSQEENIETVIQILRKLHNEGYKIGPQKIKLATTSLEILGVQYDLGKLSIPRARMLGYEKYKNPKSYKQVQTFLSSVSFFRCFLPHFSEIAHPLIKLANKANLDADTKEKFNWTETHEKSFNKLKQLIREHAGNYLPDYSRPFFGTTDASKYATGGFLYQKGDNGEILPIACISRIFLKPEPNYIVYRKEIVSLI